ncbi:MAG TPA: SpoIIE family protein phosphatase, partial [Gemmatimonadaceae bacterium]|nr:SpoIIE family protein phosphatase [Gemmatimonadaceae bacterium]
SRAATEFDLWSEPGSGMALIARFAVRGKQDSSKVRVGVVCTPIAGESVCGDAWIVEPVNAGFMIALVDGLGHGPDAAFAADTALDIIRRNKTKEPIQILEAANNALRPTRGAAVQIVTLDLRAREIRSAGVGNISASVINHEKSKIMPSHPGIVGHQMPRARETVLPWHADSLLAMHSDGISARWLMEKYPGLRLRHPSLAAGVIYRDFARPRDDATMLMLSETTTSHGLRP